MGDRGNIAIQERDGKRVYFYGHWSGDVLPKIVHDALARRQRWDDATYLARIIFCTMIKGQEAGESGFGISTEIGDNEYPVLVVDCQNQEVFAETAGRYRAHTPIHFSFAQFADLAQATWNDLDAGRAEDGSD
jgi:hypothetical protein